MYKPDKNSKRKTKLEWKDWAVIRQDVFTVCKGRSVRPVCPFLFHLVVVSFSRLSVAYVFSYFLFFLYLILILTTFIPPPQTYAHSADPTPTVL